MAENYVVNYEINVRAQQGIESIRKFQEATMKLDECGRKLLAFQKKIESVSAKFSQMAKKAPVFDISTSKANKKLDSVIVKLEKIHRLAKKVAVLNVSATSRAGGKGGRSPSSTPAAVPVGKKSSSKKNIIPKNIGYRNFGPTMIDSSGIGAFDMLKGMGVAYGLSGIGALMGGALRESTEYDNIMQTTKNILSTHDKLPDFERRFKEMAQTVRNVGVETKFTAPQVADASRFLAMAGFNLNDINQSIRPIADIALVGDTDLGETADVVTNIMTGYNIPANKLRKAADIMTMSFTKTNTTLMDIAEAYKYSASLLSVAGISFEEATAGLGILGDAGIKSSQAGTTMRTIVANIANPTKKQDAVWKKMGVKRIDGKGDIRPLLSIFQDLHKKNLNVTDFYNLFHKTAAQGAASLTNSVDKWNEVICKNFLSDGLVAKLANEKKNTIQGLWYQLTSAFTENGLKVFEESQGPIRNFLKQTINWLESPEALQTMRDLSKCLLDLIVMLKDFGIRCVKAYNIMSWFIQPWLKFQVIMWPILSFVRAFKALGNFGMYIVSIVMSITKLTGSIKGLVGAIKLIKEAGIISTLKSLFVGAASTARANTTATIAGALGLPTNQPFSIIKGGKGAFTTTGAPVAGGGFKMFVGGATGGLLGGYFGSKIGENVSGELGGILGGLAGTLLGGAGGAALFAALSNPVGWGVLAATAVGSIAYYFKQYHDNIDKCTLANNEFLVSTQAINGINMSEHATMADKYLSIVYNKQMGVNQAIGEHINLMREQLGLMKQAEQDSTDTLSFKESHKKIYDDANAAFGKFASFEEKYAAATSLLYDINGNLDFDMNVYKRENLDGNGKNSTNLEFNGVNFGDIGNEGIYSQIAAARELYSLGRDTGEGSYARSLIDNYHSRILQSSSVEDFDAVIKDLYGFMNSMTYSTGSEHWDMKTIGENTFSKNKKGYHYVEAVRKILDEQFNYSFPKTAEANLLSTFKQILLQSKDGKTISDDLLGKLLVQTGNFIFDEKKYGKFASDDFLKNFGFYDNKWNAGVYEFFNEKTGRKEQINVTADEARRSFLLFHQKIIDLVNQLSPRMQSYFYGFINNPVWQLAQQTDWNKNDNTEDSSDIKYTNGKFYKKVPDGVSKEGYTWQPITDLTSDALNNKFNGGGADQSKYKSHYQSGSAAPKQIIVKIENLMNVKSIDLANSDNVAVIENIKGQLTQALVDVVHDFDNTFHG